MVQYAFHLNGGICTGCKTCQVACKETYKLPVNNLYRKVYNYQGGSWKPTEAGHYVPEGVFGYFVSLACNHCTNPACVANCPTGAMQKDEETGIVLVNAEDCIGCESCLTGCPYGVRQLNPKTNTIEKCTLCFQRKNDENWVPACVHNCCCGARTFGDLDDPNSEAAKVVAAAGENAHYLFDPADLHPTTVYILSEKTAKWQEEPVEVTRYEKK